MNDIDNKIRKALKDSDNSDELFEERNIMMEAMTPFRGRRRWVNTLGLAYGILGLVLAIWAGFKFYNADVVGDQIQWGGLCLLGILFTSFLKVWFWMEMHTNRVLREVKRVELLILENKK